MSRYLEHIVKPFERWDHLAWEYYGSPAQFGLIIAANRELFIGALDPVPEFLPVGRTVRIPIVEGSRKARPEDLPPWLR